jgi:hypothetical protein
VNKLECVQGVDQRAAVSNTPSAVGSAQDYVLMNNFECVQGANTPVEPFLIPLPEVKVYLLS